MPRLRTQAQVTELQFRPATEADVPQRGRSKYDPLLTALVASQQVVTCPRGETGSFQASLYSLARNRHLGKVCVRRISDTEVLVGLVME